MSSKDSQASSRPPQRKHMHILIASSISCLVNMTLTNPFEVKKLRVQYSPVTCPQWPHLNFRQLNNCQCTQIGFREIFKGLSVSLFHGLISNTLYMQLYEYQRSILINHVSSGVATLSSALIGRLIVTTVMNPIQAFRVRYTNSTENMNIKMSKAGLKATLVRDLTYSALFWFSVQEVRNFIMGDQYRKHKGEKNIFYTNVLPAAVAGSVISAITTPIDTIKTRLQSGVQLDGSLWSCLKQIHKKEGISGLFSGVQFRVMRNTMSSVIYITMMEQILGYLQKHQNTNTKATH